VCLIKHCHNVIGEWRYEYSPIILDLGRKWSDVSFTPRPLYPRYPLVPKAGLDVVEKRKISCRCRESNPLITCRYTDRAVPYRQWEKFWLAET
jgi:hypothetical protein